MIVTVPRGTRPGSGPASHRARPDRTTAVIVPGATLFDGRTASPRWAGRAGAQPERGVERRAGASEGRAGVGDDAAGRSVRSVAVDGLADGRVVSAPVFSGRVEGAGVGLSLIHI